MSKSHINSKQRIFWRSKHKRPLPKIEEEKTPPPHNDSLKSKFDF